MSKKCVFVDWDHAPHLTHDQKQAILASIPPWQRESRTKGIPTIGVGSIYTVPEEEFVVGPIPIAPHWPRCFALDVGWKVNASLFAAWDKDSDTVYIYDEIYKSKSEPAVVAAAIKSRGDWIPGVIDPAARGRSQKDGTQLLYIYRNDLGLDIRPAINAVESGLTRVWERLSQGRLKIFSSCQNILAEYRLYRRDKKGEIVKSNDHLMDCLRYMIMSGLDRAEVEPQRRSGTKRWFDWEAPFTFTG